jgi:hypothetical protein
MLLSRPPEFRHFVEYLKKNPPRYPVDVQKLRGPLAIGAGLLSGGLVFPFALVGSVISSLGPGPTAAISVGAAAAAAVAAGVITLKRLPRKHESVLRAEIRRADNLRVFHDLLSGRKLGEKVDPMVIQLLDASAVHYGRVHAMANGPSWTKESSGTRSQLREQILTASEEAMDELLDLAKSCVGEPRRKDQITDFVDGMATFDFADAITRLKGMVSADAWVDRAHRSPNASLVFDPMRSIAERLKMLADELEQTSVSMISTMDTPRTSSLALDGLLAEVRAVREAEEELHLGS